MTIEVCAKCCATCFSDLSFKFQDVKDTKTRFQALGRAVVEVFAVAYELYSRSEDREDLKGTLVEMARYVFG